MIRSLYSGISGLKNHQTRMDVIGNNISNVNTTGFKSGRVTFTDTLNQTLSGASMARDGRGGVNPKQIGLGSAIGAIDTIFTDGSVSATGKNTDLCLSGSGLFVVKDGNSTFYTRNGAFEFDEEGNYVMPGNGLFVQGWMASNGNLDTNGAPGNINVQLGKPMESTATLNAVYANNLDSAALTIESITYTQNDGTIKTVDGSFGESSDTITLTLDDGKKTAPMSPALAAQYQTGAEFTGNMGDFKVNSFTSAIDNDITLTVDSKYLNIVLNPVKAGSVVQLGDTSSIETIVSATANTDGTVTLDFGTNGRVNSITVPQPRTGSFSAGDQFVVDYKITSMAANAGVKADLEGYGDYTLAQAETVSKNAEYIEPATTSGAKIVTITRNSGGGSKIAVDGEDILSASLKMSDGSTLKVSSGTYTINHSTPISTSFTAYDSQGNAHIVPVLIEKSSENTWQLSLATNTITEDDGTVTTMNLEASDVVFDENGAYLSGSAIVSMNYSKGNGAADGIIALDLTQLTQYSGSSTINAAADGNAAGNLKSVTIDSSGIIYGTYTNGVVQAEAQVAVAQFSNASGLIKNGGSLYIESNNSGTPNVNTAANLGVTITPSALELSNVDIANEFSDMIVTQRGFQSNSKIITVSDEMLETLINMKR